MFNRDFKIGLTSLMTVILAGLMLIASLLVAGALYLTYDVRLQKEFQRVAVAEAREVGLEINRQLNQVRNRLLELVRDNGIRVTMMLQVDYQLKEKLSSYHDKPSGTAYSILRDGKDAVFFSSGPSGFDRAFILRYLSGLEKKGEISRAPNGQYIVGLVEPIMRRSERLGWAGSVYQFRLDDFWTHLLGSSSGKRLLFQNSHEVANLFNGRTVLLEETGGRVKGPEDFPVYQLDGRAGVMVPVRNFPQLCLFVPTGELSDARTQGLMLVLLVAFCVSLLAFVAAVYISRQLNRPLKTAIGSLEKLVIEGNVSGSVAGEKYIRELSEFSASLRHIVVSLVAAKANAEKANAQKDRFFARMSHELRTPLNPIIGLSEMLIEENDDPMELEPLTRINRAANNLLGMISDMLDYSEIEAGELRLKSSEFEVKGMVQKVVKLMKPVVASRGNQLQLVCSDSVGSMTADIVRLEQVLINLISNANKATVSGKIVLTAASCALESGTQFVFSVKDNGVGIAPEKLAGLFEEMFDLDAPGGSEGGATGLGLAICKRLIKIMSGHVQVESELGSGTIFTVVLPEAA